MFRLRLGPRSLPKYLATWSCLSETSSIHAARRGRSPLNRGTTLDNLASRRWQSSNASSSWTSIRRSPFTTIIVASIAALATATVVVKRGYPAEVEKQPGFAGLAEQAIKCGPPSSEDEVISTILHQEAKIFTGHQRAVDTYHIARVSSNSPVEDQFAHGSLHSDKGLLVASWPVWAVFDGHAGSHTAELLAKDMIPSVEKALARLPRDTADEIVAATIKASFVALDDAIVMDAMKVIQSDSAYYRKVETLAPAYTGSCALLALLNPETRILTVACAGDSRAVLGQRTVGDGTWVAQALSVDQTGSNEEEISRINAEHPGESGIVKGGRVLGIMISRAFGDGRWKWPLDFQKEYLKHFDGFKMLAPEKYPVKTPPYLTAEPVVTQTHIDAEQPSFLILASDGFWDRVSNEQAISLVSQWINQKERGFETKSEAPRPSLGPYIAEKHRQGESGFSFSDERTTIQDSNVAVHLIRNALGGAHQEMVKANLALGPPFSRYIRDDITVQVIFFSPERR